MVVQAEQDEIPFADFPELDKLCWNEHGRTIPAMSSEARAAIDQILSKAGGGFVHISGKD